MIKKAQKRRKSNSRKSVRWSAVPDAPTLVYVGPTVFASNQLNTPACSFFKQTMSILLKTTRYMTFLRDLEVPDLIF